VKAETMMTLKKFKPAALKLVDKETKDELFAASMGSSASFGKYGVCFPNKTEDGFAQVTLTLPTELKDEAAKKAYVQDTYGYALLSLNTLENQIASTMEEVGDDLAAINESIEVL
jgi:hypothetical protein